MGARDNRRNVWISPEHWAALRLVADLNRTSISDELRRAAERHVERYGLSFVDGELTINPLLWPTEIVRGDQSEILMGEEICRGGEIQQGDQISGGGAEVESMREDAL